MNIIILILLVLSLVLFIMASSDGGSKKGYLGLSLWVLAEIIQHLV